MPEKKKIALLGWSLQAVEALDAIGREYVVVAPDAFEAYAAEHDIPFIGWDFERRNEQSHELVGRLREADAGVAVPLYEECVLWSGAVNAQLRGNPKLYGQALLFRDKAIMKRNAHMSGLRVGLFEEADSLEDVRRFYRRVNQALLKLGGEVEDPIHLKPLAAAGSVGHKVIRSEKDIDALDLEDFPFLCESHLDGQEFSCEVFVHERKIRFLNITEYVHLGHSNFVPASPGLQEYRGHIREACQQLIEAFDVDYGMLHPEWFIRPDGKISFGEVAARVPGGHIFELIHRAYGFDPFAGFALCCDPESTDAELEAFFPREDEFGGHAGCLMVYPRGKTARELEVPEGLTDDPYFEKHNLFVPATSKVQERVGFGNHYGTIFMFGEDPERMRKLLLEWEDYDFYS